MEEEGLKKVKRHERNDDGRKMNACLHDLHKQALHKPRLKPAAEKPTESKPACGRN